MGNSDNQIVKGREAMKYFHNHASRYPGYELTFDQLLDSVGGGGAKTSVFLEGLGMAIDTIQEDGFLSGSKVQKSMESLADQGQGRIPSNKNAFFKALSDEAQDTTWVEASKYVAVESAKKIGSGLVQVGDTLMSTAESLKNIFPILVVGAIIFVVVSKTRKLAA